VCCPPGAGVETHLTQYCWGTPGMNEPHQATITHVLGGNITRGDNNIL
jgi:hypothetical protein